MGLDKAFQRGGPSGEMRTGMKELSLGEQGWDQNRMAFLCARSQHLCMVLGRTGCHLGSGRDTRSVCWWQCGRRKAEAEEMGWKLARSHGGPGRNWGCRRGLERTESVSLKIRKH